MATYSRDEIKRILKDPKLLQDRSFVLDLTNSDHFQGRSMQNLPERFRDDKEIVLAFCTRASGFNLEYASPRLQDDEEVVYAAINQTGPYHVVEHASLRLRNDPEMMYYAFRRNPLSMDEIGDELRDDKAFFMKICSERGDAIQYASERLRDDKELALTACKTRDPVVRFLSPRLRDDDEIAEFLLSSDLGIVVGLQKMSDRILSNSEFMCRARAQGLVWLQKKLPSAIRNDKQFVMLSMQKGDYLDYAGEAMKDDFEVVMEAVRHRRSNLTAASDRLKNNRLIALLACDGHFPYMAYWQADDCSGEHEDNMFDELGTEIRKDPIFIREIADAFMKTTHAAPYTREEIYALGDRIYSLLWEIGRENYFCMGYYKKEEQLDLTDAIRREEERRASAAGTGSE